MIIKHTTLTGLWCVNLGQIWQLSTPKERLSELQGGEKRIRTKKLTEDNMRIEELSVGDWVAFGGKKYRIKIIDSPYHSVTLWGNNEQREESVELISPIPLTSAILANNGFEIDRHRHICNIYTWRICIWGNGKDCEVEISQPYDQSGDGFYADIKLPNAQVHQLQHILRLTGIDKEITL